MRPWTPPTSSESEGKADDGKRGIQKGGRPRWVRRSRVGRGRDHDAHDEDDDGGCEHPEIAVDVGSSRAARACRDGNEQPEGKPDRQQRIDDDDKIGDGPGECDENPIALRAPSSMYRPIRSTGLAGNNDIGAKATIR